MMTPTREAIIILRETEGLTREQIAEHYDVSLATVRRWIKELNIPRPSKQVRYKEPSHLSRIGEIIAEPDDGITIMEQVKNILGDRLTERRGSGYILDGRPTHTDQIVRAAGLRWRDGS